MNSVSANTSNSTTTEESKTLLRGTAMLTNPYKIAKGVYSWKVDPDLKPLVIPDGQKIIKKTYNNERGTKEVTTIMLRTEADITIVTE
jgi:hypothetical protein